MSETFEQVLPRWKARPTAFVLEVFDASPDTWQIEALVHLADRPPTKNDLRDIYVEVRRNYAARRKLPGKDGKFAKLNWEASQKWTDWDWLKADYEKPFQRVSVSSGHGCGKSSVMAWAVLWLQTCFFPLKVGATAPTQHQLEDVLWAEIGKWHRKMPKWLQQQIIVGDLRVMLSGHEKLSFTTGRTARREQPEALQGLHAENTGVVIDECSGVPDVVFESSEGIMTSESTRALLCSNPTRTNGFFFDTHTRLPGWYRLTVSGEDEPSRTRVGETFINQIAARYGSESNGYRIRVQGLFPRMDDDAVIPHYLVEDAMARKVDPYIDAPVVWGLDPARMGNDRTALSMRKGNVKLGPTLWWAKQDTMQTVGRIVRFYEQAPLEYRPTEIIIDSIGMGAPIYDRLREVGLPATACDIQGNASEQEGFLRLYSEMWWRCRQWFESGDSRLDETPRIKDLYGANVGQHIDFIRELTTPRYSIQSNGKIAVEYKEKVKERVQEKQSPDLAESFVLTFLSTRGRAGRTGKRLPYRSLNPLSRIA